MNVNKYKELKKVCCRINHLVQGFMPFLSEEELKDLNYDLVLIAEKENQLGLLNYIKIE